MLKEILSVSHFVIRQMWDIFRNEYTLETLQNKMTSSFIFCVISSLWWKLSDYKTAWNFYWISNEMIDDSATQDCQGWQNLTLILSLYQNTRIEASRLEKDQNNLLMEKMHNFNIGHSGLLFVGLCWKDFA